MKLLSALFLLIRTLLCYLFGGVIILFVIMPLMVILLILPASQCSNNRFIFWLLNLFYKSTLYALLVPIKITGKENIPDEPAIIIANHQSAIDIPAVGSVLKKHPHIWYAMAYYAHMFFVGFFVRRLGIQVSHENHGSAARSLIQAIRAAETESNHIIIFPEGGRYNDGTIHEFFNGYVLMARTTKRPVAPIFMPYNGKIYPPRGFWVRWHPLVIIIGPAFRYEEHDTDETFANRVYTWFVQQNSALQK